MGLLLAMPVIAEAQPHPLRVSQLNADPKKYHEQEVVLRAYFVTDIDHYSIFMESRAVDEEGNRKFRAYPDGKDEEEARAAYWRDLESDGKYCVMVLNATRLYKKFGRPDAVNKRTVSVRGIFIADAGKNVLGNGCQGHDGGFLITEVLRKED
jgi:hypothetical protein